MNTMNLNSTLQYKKWKTKQLHKKIFSYIDRTTWMQCNSYQKYLRWNARSFDKWEYVKDTPYTVNYISDGLSLWFWGYYPSLWEGNGGSRQKANAIDGTKGMYNLQKPTTGGQLLLGGSHFPKPLKLQNSLFYNLEHE